MAHFCSNHRLICPMLVCLCLLVACDSSVFPRIEHLVSKRAGSVAFLVVGDWGRGGLYNQSRVAYQMGEIGRKLNIDFVVSTGDNFYEDGLKGVDDPFFRTSFTDIYKARSLQKPWYTVLGNHDYQGNTEAQLSPALKKLDRRWFCKRSFVVGAGLLDIIFIDTTPFVQAYFDNPKKKFDWSNVLPREKYLTEVSQNLDLALRKSKATWKIVVAHHPIRSIGYHGDTEEIVNKILPILEAHKVRMYINGHDHCLQHLSNKSGLMQFLTSGGGSKAWKNIMNKGKSNDSSSHFYYDGQGFVSVRVTKAKAYIAFFDVLGKPLHFLIIK